MKLSKFSTDNRTVGIIHIGFGLIGQAIDTALSVRTIEIGQFKIDWGKTDHIPTLMDNLVQRVVGIDEIEIIWAAGRAGFSTDSPQANLELSFFELFLNALKDELSGLSLRCWLMSSAGGLHEGQICVSEGMEINQSRPYAILKRQQELLVRSLFDRHVICRLSSVYTVDNLSGRLGLLAVLMRDGIRHKVSTLVGSESTLRDYVLDRDIGKYISEGILNRSEHQGIQYLVNGSPQSIAMIKLLIERIIMKKLYIKYAPVKSNAANITFQPKIKAEGFYNSDLSSNIKILYNSLLSYSS